MMRDLSRLTVEEKNRYLILKSSLVNMLCLSLEDVIDSSLDFEILKEIEYLENLADDKITRDNSKVKINKPNNNKSQKK